MVSEAIVPALLAENKAVVGQHDLSRSTEPLLTPLIVRCSGDNNEHLRHSSKDGSR